MSSISLERYRDKYPTERAALGNLEALLRDKKQRRFTLDGFADQLGANSRDELALILAELAVAGIIGFNFLVRSPRTHQPIRRFRDLSEIPKTLRDPTADTTIVVEPDSVEPEYETPGR